MSTGDTVVSDPPAAHPSRSWVNLGNRSSMASKTRRPTRLPGGDSSKPIPRAKRTLRLDEIYQQKFESV
jgi:hypothetical protein